MYKTYIFEKKNLQHGADNSQTVYTEPEATALSVLFERFLHRMVQVSLLCCHTLTAITVRLEHSN